MPSAKMTTWSGGADNLSSDSRLQNGFVRSAVNVDPTPGGKLALRAGYRKVYEGQDVRGVLALGDRLLIADGGALIEFDALSGTYQQVRAIAAAGQFIGCQLNGRLYFQTDNEALVYDGREIRPWGVPTVNSQPVPAVRAGGALGGALRIAVTFSDADGTEGGTDMPLLMSAPEGSSLEFYLPDPPAGGRVNLYVSSMGSESLYLQESRTTGGRLVLSATRDDSRVLTNTNMRGPLIGSIVRAHLGQIVVASGKTLWATAPMRPHLIDMQRGFFQFPEAIGEVVSAQTVLYVSSDKTYSLTGIEGDAAAQRSVFDFGAVPGTGVNLPDGRAAWMTRYGQAITTMDGGMELVTRKHFVPQVPQRGTAGLLDHNGNQLIVTAADGVQSRNSLAATDFFNGEVIR